MGKDEGGAGAIPVARAFDLLDGGFQHRLLDRLALAVERIEMVGDLVCLVVILGGQQARAQAGLAHAAAGIDPGPEDEAQVVDPRRLFQPGHVAQCPDPGIAALTHHREPLAHERAVDAGERHHVADGAERHQVEPLLEVRLLPIAIPAGLAQVPVEPDDEEEGDSNGGELAVRALLIQPVGVDHGEGRGQPGLAEVVVDHDHVEARIRCFGERVEGADAAIDGDDHPHVRCRQLAHGGGVGAVALAQAVGDIDRHRARDRREEAAQQRRRGRAVHVIVAEDRDLLARCKRAGEADHRLLHVAQVQRVG